MRSVKVKVGRVLFDNKSPLVFMAGPCALESERLLLGVGRRLKAFCAELRAPFVLKCSFDKANRTSVKS